MTELPLTLAGENLLALAARALFWPAEKTLFVADIHFGKDATFRQAHRWVPPGTTGDDLSRLSRLLRERDAKRLVILGDAFHSEHAGEDATFAELQGWRSETSVDILMIRGNHDRRAEELATRLDFTLSDQGHRLGPWSLHHHPAPSAQSGYVLCGHVHPAAVVRGLARQWLRLPCFWAGPHQCILPAFGGFTGDGVVKPRRGDRVLLVADDRLLDASST